jgi:hypothetical protein
VTSGPNYWDVIAVQMANVAPFLLAYVVGIVVVFLRRRRCPKAATLAIAALTLMFLSGFLGSALQGYLFADFSGNSMTSTAWLVSLVGWGRGLVNLIALGLLVAAVFTGRPPALPSDD